jgi:hypothetical protein
VTLNSEQSPERINESAKLELEQRVKLYEFYVGAYIKGIAFYLAITGVLLKFAMDCDRYRGVFSAVGLLCSFAILIPLWFAIRHERELQRRFLELAALTATKPISTSPLLVLSCATACFWVIMLSAGYTSSTGSDVNRPVGKANAF